MSGTPDIVERLREPYEQTQSRRPELELKAADTIEAQQATITELREALEPFAEPHPMGDNYVSFAPRLIEAAAALLTKLREQNT